MSARELLAETRSMIAECDSDDELRLKALGLLEDALIRRGENQSYRDVGACFDEVIPDLDGSEFVHK